MSLLHVNLTPTAYAILGLLHERSMHGYEIAQHFKPDTDLGQVVPADMSTVYSFLKDLQEHGLLSGKRETVGARPPRTVFSLTAEAEGLFLAWVRSPVARIREVRLDFLLKLYFARRLSATKAHALVEAQLTVCRDYRTRQQRQVEELDATSFEFLVLRIGSKPKICLYVDVCWLFRRGRKNYRRGRLDFFDRSCLRRIVAIEPRDCLFELLRADHADQLLPHVAGEEIFGKHQIVVFPFNRYEV